MLNGTPAIQAALNWIVAIPDAVFGGIGKSTRYLSVSPGHAIALITSTGSPFTVTSVGELIRCKAFAESDGNGSPGSTPGTVGPIPLTMLMRTSPAFAGLIMVTGVK